MEDFGHIKMHEEQIKHAIITIEKGRSPLKELIEPFSPSLFREQSPIPMLIGADFGRGKDFHSLMLIENASGKVIHCSKDAIVSINSDWIAKVRENNFGHLPSPSCRAEWNAQVNLTHKQTRQIRKALKLKKPRIPRKLKKKLKTDLKLMRYARGK